MNIHEGMVISLLLIRPLKKTDGNDHDVLYGKKVALKSI